MCLRQSSLSSRFSSRYLLKVSTLILSRIWGKIYLKPKPYSHNPHFLLPNKGVLLAISFFFSPSVLSLTHFWVLNYKVIPKYLQFTSLSEMLCLRNHLQKVAIFTQIKRCVVCGLCALSENSKLVLYNLIN